MKTAVLYARVSSREQEQEGFSIPAQIKCLREYAQAHQIEIVEDFVEAETAKQAGRKRFGEMLAYLRSHPSCRIILVEKTDRLHRNMKDYVLLKELDAAIHLVKEGQVISRDSQSNAKFIYGIKTVVAENFIENLREEVNKGMRGKAETGVYPSRPPLGYVNDKATGGIAVQPDRASVAVRMFELYATGELSIAQLAKVLRREFGCTLAKGYIHKLLGHPFYRGRFEWQGVMYEGTHQRFIPVSLCEGVDLVLHRGNRPRYQKHRFAFSGLLTCAHDGCMVTAERKKQKYTYYHCTGYRGRCALPYMREETLGLSLSSILEGIYVPDAAIDEIARSQESQALRAAAGRERETIQLGRGLQEVRRKKQQTYEDKLNGSISEAFWRELHARWIEEESDLAARLGQLMQPITADQQMTVKRILELANTAPALYKTRNPPQQADLLRMIVSKCATDGLNHWPVYRKPFDLIFQRAKVKEWCAREDSNF